MKNWKRTIILSGLIVVVTGGILYGTVSANILPLDVQAKLEEGLPADADIPTYKLQALLKENQLREAAKGQPPASKNFSEPPQSIGPVEKGPTGILPGSEGPVPVPGRVFTINNRWVGDINGKLTVVFAGVETQNAKQGVAWLFQPEGSDISNYRTSALDGGLTITSVNGSILTLKATDGATYAFDIATQSLTRE